MAKQTPPPKIEPLRPKTPTFTIKTRIWSAIISVNSVRIILTHLEPRATNATFLRSRFFEIGLTSAGSNTKLKLKARMLFFLLRTNLKFFFGKVLENLSYL